VFNFFHNEEVSLRGREAAGLRGSSTDRGRMGRNPPRAPAGGAALARLQEDSFHLVDNKPVQKPKYGNRRFQQSRQQQQQRQRDGRLDGGKVRDEEAAGCLVGAAAALPQPHSPDPAVPAPPSPPVWRPCPAAGPAAPLQEPERKKLPQQKKNPWQQGWQNRFDNRNQVQYSSSIDIRPEWSVVEQITHQALGKLSCRWVGLQPAACRLLPGSRAAPAAQWSDGALGAPQAPGCRLTD